MTTTAITGLTIDANYVARWNMDTFNSFRFRVLDEYDRPVGDTSHSTTMNSVDLKVYDQTDDIWYCIKRRKGGLRTYKFIIIGYEGTDDSLPESVDFTYKHVSLWTRFREKIEKAQAWWLPRFGHVNAQGTPRRVRPWLLMLLLLSLVVVSFDAYRKYSLYRIVFSNMFTKDVAADTTSAPARTKSSTVSNRQPAPPNGAGANVPAISDQDASLTLINNGLAELDKKRLELEASIRRLESLRSVVAGSSTNPLKNTDRVIATNQPTNVAMASGATNINSRVAVGNNNGVITYNENHFHSGGAVVTNNSPLLAGMPEKPDSVEWLNLDGVQKTPGLEVKFERVVGTGNGTLFHTPEGWDSDTAFWTERSNIRVWINKGTSKTPEWEQMEFGGTQSRRHIEAYWVQALNEGFKAVLIFKPTPP